MSDIIKEALINGEVVNLDDAEAEKAANFHLSRLAFIYIDGELNFNNNQNDSRDHQHWVADDFGISPDEFENLNRGYITDGRIQFFKGSDFRKIDLSEISLEDIERIVDAHSYNFESKNISIYNGVKVGKVGEIWEPLEKIFEVHL